MKTIRYNPDKMLSHDFRLGEFIECEKAWWGDHDNTPTSWEVIIHLRQLSREVLQPLRDHYGRPLRIVCGYRTEALNMALHGVGASLHVIGCAADLWLPDIDTGRQWYYWLVNHVDFDQVFLEVSHHGDRCLHVSHQPDYKSNRHMSFFNTNAL